MHFIPSSNVYKHQQNAQEYVCQHFWPHFNAQKLEYFKAVLLIVSQPDQQTFPFS